MYYSSINTTEGFAKKNDFSEEQLKELKQINLKAKINYLRCFIKLDKPDLKQQEFGKSYSSELIKVRGDEVLSYYLKSAFLLKARYLNDSLIYAEKAVKMEESKDCVNLLADVKRAIELKNKGQKV